MQMRWGGRGIGNEIVAAGAPPGPHRVAPCFPAAPHATTACRRERLAVRRAAHHESHSFATAARSRHDSPAGRRTAHHRVARRLAPLPTPLRRRLPWPPWIHGSWPHSMTRPQRSRCSPSCTGKSHVPGRERAGRAARALRRRRGGQIHPVERPGGPRHAVRAPHGDGDHEVGAGRDTGGIEAPRHPGQNHARGPGRSEQRDQERQVRLRAQRHSATVAVHPSTRVLDVRSHWRRLALLFLAALWSAACDLARPSTHHVFRADSAGVEIVVNAGPDRPLAWTIEPVWTAGGLENQRFSLTRLFRRDVVADRAGRMYVLDRAGYAAPATRTSCRASRRWPWRPRARCGCYGVWWRMNRARSMSLRPTASTSVRCRPGLPSRPPSFLMTDRRRGHGFAGRPADHRLPNRSSVSVWRV